jgi:hypothetical protein
MALRFGTENELGPLGTEGVSFATRRKYPEIGFV